MEGWPGGSADTGGGGRCAHELARVPPRPVTLRWRCRRCGLVTRYYDGLDVGMGRPMSRHMDVALRGVDTARDDDGLLDRLRSRLEAARELRRLRG
ncbi:hypothetical protein [Motilibacter aurantiacus]|uniref:hypothetical protein n=1 Tax=Motilibacter aurantiacus TaxID=2714955 RepID=UPI00140E6836|nr:hypothetical protein [Motilibacter aurantiacus]NHC45301.1 hypothetical protein [Motilibacter aurantiacus]